MGARPDRIRAGRADKVETLAVLHREHDDDVRVLVLERVAQGARGIHGRLAEIRRHETRALHGHGAREKGVRAGGCDLLVQGFDLLLLTADLRIQRRRAHGHVRRRAGLEGLRRFADQGVAFGHEREDAASGDRFDPAHARRHGGFRDDLEEPDVGGVRAVRAAAELGGEAAHLHHADDGAVLLAEEGHRARLFRRLHVGLDRRDREGGENLLVDHGFHVLELFRRQRGEVREVEAQRQLSLGQRMRSDIVASLLHSPKIVFFDEPTIGVDVIGKETIRSFIRELNEKDKITMIFTTHDMQDIEQTCNRIIIIDKGSLMYDGSLQEIRSKYGTSRRLIAEFNEATAVDPIKNVIIEDMKDRKVSFTFDNNVVDVNKLMHEVLEKYSVHDVTVAEPEIESIIQKIYKGEVSA